MILAETVTTPEQVCESLQNSACNTVLLETYESKAVIRKILIEKMNLPVEIEEFATTGSRLSELKTLIIQRKGTKMKITTLSVLVLPPRPQISED